MTWSAKHLGARFLDDALSDRSIWDKFGRGLDLLSRVVIAPLWFTPGSVELVGSVQASALQLDSDSFMP